MAAARCPLPPTRRSSSGTSKPGIRSPPRMRCIRCLLYFPGTSGIAVAGGIPLPSSHLRKANDLGADHPTISGLSEISRNECASRSASARCARAYRRTSISCHCDRPHLINIVAASSHTKGTHESVCGTPKWKLENGAQRPASETRPSTTETPKIAGQRLGRASLTRGNVADSHTPGK